MTAIYPTTKAAIRARAAALDGVHSAQLTQADWDRRWLLEYVDEQARVIRAKDADIARIDAERTAAEREADRWKDRVTELESVERPPWKPTGPDATTIEDAMAGPPAVRTTRRATTSEIDCDD